MGYPMITYGTSHTTSCMGCPIGCCVPHFRDVPYPGMGYSYEYPMLGCPDQFPYGTSLSISQVGTSLSTSHMGCPIGFWDIPCRHRDIPKKIGTSLWSTWRYQMLEKIHTSDFQPQIIPAEIVSTFFFRSWIFYSYFFHFRCGLNDLIFEWVFFFGDVKTPVAVMLSSYVITVSCVGVARGATWWWEPC